MTRDIEAVLVETKSGRFAVRGELFVDGTGDGDLAASLAKYADVKDDVIKRRDELARAMSPAQIDEAKKLSADWKARPNR